MATSLFNTLFNRAPPAAPPPHFPYTHETNPYTAKRPWPPDFAQLSSKHQFRLERRYRRRTKLKWARPTWTKVMKLTQWGSILGVLVYGVLFLDISEGKERGIGEAKVQGRTVFDGIRGWYRAQMSGFERARESPGGVESRVETGKGQGG